MRIPYCFIWDVWHDRLEAHRLNGLRYHTMQANEQGRYPIPEMNVELGIWRGRYQGHDTSWIRWFLPDGTMLLTGEERADALAAKLRSLGIDPDAP